MIITTQAFELYLWLFHCACLARTSLADDDDAVIVFSHFQAAARFLQPLEFLLLALCQNEDIDIESPSRSRKLTAALGWLREDASLLSAGEDKRELTDSKQPKHLLPLLRSYVGQNNLLDMKADEGCVDIERQAGDFGGGEDDKGGIAYLLRLTKPVAASFLSAFEGESPLRDLFDHAVQRRCAFGNIKNLQGEGDNAGRLVCGDSNCARACQHYEKGEIPSFHDRTQQPRTCFNNPENESEDHDNGLQ